MSPRLVRAAARGSSEAFGELVRRYRDSVFNACVRICGQEADALDVTQSAFVKALEALPKFEQRSSFYTWIFRIAVNLAISQKRRGRRAVQLAETFERETDASTDPGTAVETIELRGRLGAALRALDDEFRVALVLKDIEDMDYATIAEILDVPLGTAKSRIHRGRMMLRAALQSSEEQIGHERA